MTLPPPPPPPPPPPLAPSMNAVFPLLTQAAAAAEAEAEGPSDAAAAGAADMGSSAASAAAAAAALRDVFDWRSRGVGAGVKVDGFGKPVRKARVHRALAYHSRASRGNVNRMPWYGICSWYRGSAKMFRWRTSPKSRGFQPWTSVSVREATWIDAALARPGPRVGLQPNQNQ